MTSTNNNAFNFNYKNFITTIIQNEQVYALKNKDGYATSFSNDMVDEEEEAIEVFCFWSNEAGATALINDEWADFQVDVIALDAFVENWCVGMNNEGLLLGIDFDTNLEGFEADPLVLILDILEAAQAAGKTLHFTKFKDMDDLATQVRNILAE